MNETQDTKVVNKRVSRAILEQGVDFTVTIERPKLVERLLAKLGLYSLKRVFVIKPLCLGTSFKISTLLEEIDVRSHIDSYGDILKHAEKLVEIVALAIVNSDEEPSNRVRRFLRRNLTAVELLKIVNLVVDQLNIMDFLSATVSIKGMSLFETAKDETTTKEQTTGESSETSSSTSDSNGTKSSGDEAGLTS